MLFRKLIGLRPALVGPYRPFVILVAKDRVIKRRPRTLYGLRKDLSDVFLAFTTSQKWPLALLFNKSSLEFGLIMIQSRNFPKPFIIIVRIRVRCIVKNILHTRIVDTKIRIIQ